MICNVGNAISKVFFPITTFSEASNISLTWFLNNTWAWRLFLEKPSKGNVGSFETRGVFRVWFASQCATFQTLNSKPRVSSPFSLLSLISSVIKIYSLFSGIKAYFDNQFEKLNEERREKNPDDRNMSMASKFQVTNNLSRAPKKIEIVCDGKEFGKASRRKAEAYRWWTLTSDRRRITFISSVSSLSRLGNY